MKLNITLLFLLLTVFFSCNKEEKTISTDDSNNNNTETGSVLSTEKKLLSFKFLDALNQPYLSKTIEGTVVEDAVIKIKIPDTDDISHLIASFSFTGKDVYINTQKQFSGETNNDFTKDITYTVFAEDSSKKDYVVQIERTDGLESVLPHIYITADDGASITSKDNYVHADIKIDGKGEYPDYQGRTKIRGRGNTSWGLPKKPYKLKLMQKAPLFGYAAYKKWILLANYNDGSLLLNAIPYKTGQLLGLPFTNHVIPVVFTLNGVNQGMYVFTEHKEVGKDRIDIGEKGTLLELDTYFDEPYEFYSDHYHLPVMVKYPDLEEVGEEKGLQIAENKLNELKTDFQKLENLVAAPEFPNNDYLTYFSDTAFVNYMIIYMLTDNEEINHPKSTYINKPAGTKKYRMGIIWDFDWGFGFQRQGTHFRPESASNSLFWNDGYGKQEAGTIFFGRLMTDPHIQQLFKEIWTDFKNTKYLLLKRYIEKYAEIIRPVFDKDHQIWTKRDSSGDLDTDLQRVLDWLDARINYIDSYVASF